MWPESRAWVPVTVYPEAACHGLGLCGLADPGWKPSCSASFPAHLLVSGTQVFSPV